MHCLLNQINATVGKPTLVIRLRLLKETGSRCRSRSGKIERSGAASGINIHGRGLPDASLDGAGVAVARFTLLTFEHINDGIDGAEGACATTSCAAMNDDGTGVRRFGR